MPTEIPKWDDLTDLASSSVGGRIQFATDEWFASADRLLLDKPAVFIPDEYTTYGKWMDGWESRRKRIAGHDWCIIKLGLPGRIVGIEVDTAHFTGNHAPRTSIQGAYLPNEPEPLMKLSTDWESERIGKAATEEQMRLAESIGTSEWKDILAFTPLNPGYEESRRHFFTVDCPEKITHLRLNMFPDGGIARLRVRGIVERDWSQVSPTSVVDLASVVNGGIAIGCSNKHFGEPRNLILPGRGTCMGDGWETARKSTRPPILEVGSDGLVAAPGSDWSVLKLGTVGEIKRLVIDTHFYKGNYPESVEVEALCDPTAPAQAFLDDAGGAGLGWKTLLPRVKVGADREHFFEGGEIMAIGPVSHLKLTMFPDGGVMRIRAFGTKSQSSSL